MRKGVAALLLVCALATTAEAGGGPNWHERYLAPIIVGIVTAEYTVNMAYIHGMIRGAVRNSAGWVRAWMVDRYIDGDVVTLCSHVGDDDWLPWLWTPENTERMNAKCTGLLDLDFNVASGLSSALAS